MLSLRELRRAARILDERLARARLEKLVQYDPFRLVLSFREPASGAGDDGRCHVLLSCRPGLARLSQLPTRPKAPRSPLPFAQYLRARLGRATCDGVRIVDEDRQVGFRLVAREGAFDLLLSILGPRSNLYLLDSGGILLQALRPLARSRRDLTVGARWSSPDTPAPGPGEDRFAEVPDTGFFEALERHYREREDAEGAEDLARRLDTALTRELASLERKLAALRRDLESARGADEIRRRGELLKGVLSEVRAGATRVDAVDYESGETVEIPLDPKRSAAENLDAYFKRYHKRQRAQEHLQRRIEELEGERDDHLALVSEYRTLAAAGGADPAPLAAFASRPPLVRLLARHHREPPARRRRRGPSEVPARLRPRRYRSADGLEIWVGRSDEGNDYLTTRLARGNDLFLHLEGSPGGHVVLRTEGRVDPPAESLLDAAELAVHFSSQKNAPRCDVHVVPIKNVSKPRGAKPGLVMVRGGKTLHLRREPDRLTRVLEGRLAEEEDPAGV